MIKDLVQEVDDMNLCVIFFEINLIESNPKAW